MRTIAPSVHARRRSGAELRPSSRLSRAAGQRRVAGVAALGALVLLSARRLRAAEQGHDWRGDRRKTSDSGRLFLREVPASLAAGHANLKPGDEILLIDGLDVRRMDAQQINAALSGEVDSPVKLTLIREEQVLRVTLTPHRGASPREKSLENRRNLRPERPARPGQALRQQPTGRLVSGSNSAPLLLAARGPSRRPGSLLGSAPFVVAGE